MGLLSRLLSRVQSVLNGSDDRSREWERDSGDGTVTVEHESSLSEDAGTAPSGETSDDVQTVAEDTPDTEAGGETVERGAATDAAASGVETTDGATEVEDATDSAAEPGGDSAAAATADADTDAADEAASESVDAIKGVGPAYRAELEGAGVETVAELADADAEALAAETDLSAARIANWIERARSRRE